MSSRIEQLIDEIEEYIDGCKYQTFSDTKIIVNKEEIDELLRELRMKTPDEIKRYQKIISNKEAILNDARAKAEALINEATLHTNQLINEHEIMQQAYAQANEVVTMATKQAQEILDNATMEVYFRFTSFIPQHIFFPVSVSPFVFDFTILIFMIRNIYLNGSRCDLFQLHCRSFRLWKRSR